MSVMTNLLEGELIDHLFAGGLYSHNSPASWHIALHLAAFGETGSGGNEVSTTASGYGRIAVIRNTGGWTKGTAGNVLTVENAEVITFGTPTSNWTSSGPITHVGIWDTTAGTTGLIMEAQLQFSKNVNSGDAAPKFIAGELKFTFD